MEPAGRQPASSAFRAISRRTDHRLQTHTKRINPSDKEMWNTTTKHIKIRANKLGFTCSCAFSLFTSPPRQWNTNPRVSFKCQRQLGSSPCPPTPVPCCIQAQPSTGLKLKSSEAEVKRKEEAACKVWGERKTDYEQLHIYNASQSS